MKQSYFVFAVLSVLVASIGFGGGSSGGGGETADIAGSAWFTVPRPISYCFDSAADFGISEANADKHFKAAVKTWQAYLKARSTSLHARFTKGFCDGRQDLTIYLGMETSEVKDAKKRYISPVSLVERTAYNFEDGWGKGFLWVASSGTVLSEPFTAPDWNLRLRLQILFTHELGHILGCDHFDGTIMDDYIPKYVTMVDKFSDKQLEWRKEIDQNRALVAPRPTETAIYTGELMPAESKGGLSGQGAFEVLFGRAPLGKTRGELTIGKYATQQMVVSDSLGTFTLKLAMEATRENNRVFNLGKLFRIAKLNNFSYTVSYGRVASGEVVTPDGTSYPMTLEQNAEADGKVRVHVTIKGKSYPLFYARNS
jgi:hypothetical protein